MDAERPVQPVRVLEYSPKPAGGAVFRWLRIGIVYGLAGLVGAGVGGLIAYAVIPVTYRARTLVYLRPAPGTSPQGAGPRMQFMTAQTAMITSAPVLATASRTLAMSQVLTPEWDRAIISAELDRRSDLIHIMVQHPNPMIASTSAKAITEAAINQAAAAGTNVEILEVPQPPAQLQPFRDQRWMMTAGLFGALLGLIVLFVIRQRTPSSASG